MSSRPKRSTKSPQFLADYATREEQHEVFGGDKDDVPQPSLLPAASDSRDRMTSSSSSSSPAATAALAAPADPLEQKQTTKLAPIFVAAASSTSGSSSSSSSASISVEQQLRATQRIRHLEAQLALRDAEIRSLKRQKRSLEDATMRSDPRPAKKPKTDGQKRKLFEKWAKTLMSRAKKIKTKYDACYPETVKIKESTLLTPDQFEDMFANKDGTQIQPTPTCKPSSIITMIEFGSYEAVADLFGGKDVIPEDGYLCQVWRSRRFQKSYSVGTLNHEIRSLLVEYHTKNHALTLKFEIDVQPY